jgi:hypothetical protein
LGRVGGLWRVAVKLLLHSCCYSFSNFYKFNECVI